MSDELKVYTKKETQKLLGLSGRTWDRLEALGETPRSAFFVWLAALRTPASLVAQSTWRR